MFIRRVLVVRSMLAQRVLLFDDSNYTRLVDTQAVYFEYFSSGLSMLPPRRVTIGMRGGELLLGESTGNRCFGLDCEDYRTARILPQARGFEKRFWFGMRRMGSLMFSHRNTWPC